MYVHINIYIHMGPRRPAPGRTKSCLIVSINGWKGTLSCGQISWVNRMRSSRINLPMLARCHIDAQMMKIPCNTVCKLDAETKPNHHGPFAQNMRP